MPAVEVILSSGQAEETELSGLFITIILEMHLEQND
jgi:hypothetical protein